MSRGLLLDEMMPPAIADRLRARGYDVESVAERPEARGAADSDVLELARRENRAVVTFDCIDYLELDRRSHATRTGHAGIVLVNARRFPQRAESLRALVRSLARVLDDGGPPSGAVIWLI